MSAATYTLRFNVSRPVGVVDEVTAQAIASAAGAIIDEHCIVRGARWAALSTTVAQISVTFLAANDNEAKAISHDAITETREVAIDAITLNRGAERVPCGVR